MSDPEASPHAWRVRPGVQELAAPERRGPGAGGSGPAGGWRGLALTAVAVVGLLMLIGCAGFALLARTPGALAAFASARLHRPVRFDGPVDIEPAPWGVALAFRGAHVGRPRWAGAGDALTVASGRVAFAWSSLLHIRPIAESVSLSGVTVRLNRDAQGRPDWTQRAGASDLSQPIVVRRLALTDGRILYTDLQNAVTLNARATADPSAADGMGLHVEGAGAVQGEPWRETFRAPATGLGGAGPLPLQVVIDKGASHFAFDGALPPRLDLAHVHGRLQSAGPDMHDLARLLRAPFPHTAPYRLRAGLVRDGPELRFEDIRGRTGASDVAGRLSVRREPHGRRLDGAFTSPSLAIGDLLVLVTGGQAGTGRKPHGPSRLFPDVGINAAPLRPLVGAVTLDAAAVQPTAMAIRRLRLLATFDHGRVAADPLVLGLPQGSATWRLGLDVRHATPSMVLDLSLDHAATGDLLGARAARAPIRARLDGRLHLEGSGATIHAAAAAAAGSARFSGAGGQVGKTEAELLAGDVGGALAGLLTQGGGALPLRCLRADFDVAHGRATSRRLVFATPAGAVHGQGEVDLGAETLRVVLHGRPAHPGLVRSGAYVVVDGPLNHPKVQVRQGGVLGVLKSLLSIVPKPGGGAGPPGCG